MNRLECPGLDGSNPLHFLASLGILRLLPAGARLGWRFDGHWVPWFETQVEDVPKYLSQAIRRGVPDHAEVLPAKKRDGSTDKVACDPADRKAICEAWSFLGFSEIPKVTPQQFRDAALATLVGLPSSWMGSRHPCAVLSSLNAGNVPDKDGLLEPTIFSFSNGGGMQFFLKDFLSLAALVSPESIQKLLEGDDSRFVWFTSLNWDPLALRSYANQWGDPESSPKQTDLGANALAFLGLGSLPVVPTRTRNLPPCYDPARKVFGWPLWETALNLDVVTSLLESGSQAWGPNPEAYGVVAQFESERFSSNKRLFFAPSRSV